MRKGLSLCVLQSPQFVCVRECVMQYGCTVFALGPCLRARISDKMLAEKDGQIGSMMKVRGDTVEKIAAVCSHQGESRRDGAFET